MTASPRESQTLEYIRDNIIKVVDEENTFYGTAFFIEVNQQKYCITCHHCIYKMDRIFVERSGQRYATEWMEQYSDMKKDIAVLKVENCPLKPLLYARQAMPKLNVITYGFSAEKMYNFPEGMPVQSGQLSDESFNYATKEDKKIYGTNKWNEKPKVGVNVFQYNGKFELGFGGSPVCYQGPNLVVGIFTAKDDKIGYVIPIQTLLEKFSFAPESVVRPEEEIPSEIDTVKPSTEMTTRAMRLGVYNTQNLFDRPSVMNLPTLTDSRSVLDDFYRLNDLIQKELYSQEDKEEILLLMKRNNGLLSSKAESKYIRLRVNRGRFLKSPRKEGAVEIVANGRNDWIGWFELKTETINQIAIENNARVVQEVNADVLALIEIESRDSMIRFNETVIPKIGGRKYDNVSSGGNNIGVMTRSPFSIESEKSHFNDRDEKGTIFNGDCIEYVIVSPTGIKLLLILTRFYSTHDSIEENDVDLERQAKRIRQIYLERISQGFDVIAVAGTMNDTPTSNPLQPLLGNELALTDIMNHEKFTGDGRPGTFSNGNEAQKLDYLLMSPKLTSQVRQGGIERRGVWGGTKGSLFPHFPELKTSKDAASDHAALWADLELPTILSKDSVQMPSPEVMGDILEVPSTHVITDSWTLKDALGYHVYAHALARFITHDKTVPPLCVSIQAPWGQGKTSLMRKVQAELDRDAAKELSSETSRVQLQRAIKQQKVKLQELVKEKRDYSHTELEETPPQKPQELHTRFKHLRRCFSFSWFRVTNSKKLGKRKQEYAALREIVKEELENPSEFKSLKVRSNEEGEVKQRVTIWFNAWAYESSEQVWSGLADSIVQQIAERLEPEESMRFLLGLHIRRHGTDKIIKKINDRVATKWWQNTRPRLRKYVPLIGISSVVTTLGWIDKNNFWPVAGLAGLVASIGASSLQIFQERANAQLSVQEEPAPESLGEYVDVPDYTKVSGDMWQVIEDIRIILKRIPEKYLPMVIFIDDLDRCSPNKVSNIIEALNIFLGGGYFYCMFVIGMDAEMVAAALEVSYSKVMDRLPRYPLYTATGWQFMDKFVQLPFVLPEPEKSDLKNYVKILFLQDEIKHQEIKEKEINQAAREAANEITKQTENKQVEQFTRDEQIKKITKVVAEKHGLSTEQDQELLRHEAEQRVNVEDLNRKINSFSYEDPKIRGLIEDNARYFSGNPREVKRFMNVFRFHYFLLSARQTRRLAVPSLEQLSRWIVISLKWPVVSRWLQGRADRVEMLEKIGQKCKTYDEWKTKIEKELQFGTATMSKIFDEELFDFFHHEGSTIKEKQKRLSYSAGKGLY